PPPGLDLSSREIYRYYGDQYFQAAAWREVEGRPAPFFWDHGLAFDPGNGTALEHLARSQARAGNWELAARILRQAVEARPDSAAGWFNLAGIYSRAGLRTQAGDCWGRWSRLGGKGPLAVARSRTSPKSADYYAKLSRRYATMGLGFLALKAGETSRLLSRDPSGGEL
ncbi:MAG TPA: tetratricopeptide repeat protein, partial [bacterium]|nr:tetratricopeptide repeat protein [bacterium]